MLILTDQCKHTIPSIERLACRSQSHLRITGFSGQRWNPRESGRLILLNNVRHPVSSTRRESIPRRHVRLETPILGVSGMAHMCAPCLVNALPCLGDVPDANRPVV